MSPSHEVMGESHLGVEVEVEAYALGSAARDTASPSASVPNGVVIVGYLDIVSQVLLLFFGDLIGFICGSLALFVV